MTTTKNAAWIEDSDQVLCVVRAGVEIPESVQAAFFYRAAPSNSGNTVCWCDSDEDTRALCAAINAAI